MNDHVEDGEDMENMNAKKEDHDLGDDEHFSSLFSFRFLLVGGHLYFDIVHIMDQQILF